MAIRNTLLSGTDWQDTGSTLLNGSLSNIATTITVDSTTGFKTSGEIKIGTEIISYTGVTGTTFTGCTRGAFSTTAATHSDNDAVDEKEIIQSDDLNNTFDAMVDEVQGLAGFYLTSTLYDVYDNFDSYADGDSPSGTLWNTSGTVIVKTSTNAGGSGNELRLGLVATGSNTSTATAKNLTANRHTWFRLYAHGVTYGTVSHAVSAIISFDSGSNYDTVMATSASDDIYSATALSTILVVAKGSDVYDCYIGGKKVRTVTNSSFEIIIQANHNSGNAGSYCYVYIDDVRQSKSDV